MTDKSSFNSTIVVHAGSLKGLLTDSIANYRGQTNFGKWDQETLLPNLPENSSIAMNNVLYRCHKVLKGETITFTVYGCCYC